MKNQAAKGLGGNLNPDCLGQQYKKAEPCGSWHRKVWGVPICEGSTHEDYQVRGQEGGLDERNTGFTGQWDYPVWYRNVCSNATGSGKQGQIQLWWHMPLVPAKRQMDLCEFTASLVYTVNSSTIRATCWDPVSKFHSFIRQSQRSTMCFGW